MAPPTMTNKVDTMSHEEIKKPTPNTLGANEQSPEAKKRRKKPPLIDFNALDAHQQKTIHSIATAGARVANAQNRVREGQLRAMKVTLDEILNDPDGANPQFVAVLFRELLEKANVANAKKIASHSLCPSDLANRH